jgi:tetratricopeptide (TPR) repeat protein
MNKEISEIAKFTGRISKDPKSKLFVPLAEEYKKAGDIEMAIHVLLEGLKRNPEYVIARSSLGKLLIAKGDFAGAQKEFEDVVKTSPDNLMAQKKLGDLLILQNMPHDALSHYKIALSLNPDDGELASLISDVEAGRDISSRIQATKAKTTADKAVKQDPSAVG